MSHPLKRLSCKMLAGTILLATFFTGIPMTQINANAESTVLFSSSFEAGETHEFLESTLHNDHLSNVGKGALKASIAGDVTPLLKMDSIKGSLDFHDGESKMMLFDDNTASKFLTASGATSSNPVTVSFELSAAKKVTTYLIASANDSDGRDPVSWKFFGSNNGTDWTELDSKSDVNFANRFESKTYTFTNETAYSHFKLDITKNAGEGMTQFSELRVGTGEATPGGGDDEGSPMKTTISNGPSQTWSNTPNTGWTGFKALQVLGKHEKAGEAYCSNVIYKDLNIPVDQNTNLSYVIFPSLINGLYDFEFTQMYLAVDIAFTDGTYLSDLNAVDQNGNIVSPVAQGESKTLYTMQYNYIKSNIGAVAEGKTIDKILIAYEKPDNKNDGDSSFLAFFDDINIESPTPVIYENLSDYVSILRGTNSTSSFSRGLTAPAVTVPHGFNFYTPVTNSRSSHPYTYQLSGTKNTLSHITITHIPSNWISDSGTWQFMANSSFDIANISGGNQIDATARKAEFRHENETAKAHYYSVEFDEGSIASNVKIEVTPTSHAAYVRFTFPEDAENRNVIFDCEKANGGLSFNETENSFTAYSDHTANGSKRMHVYGEFLNDYDSAKIVNTKQGIVSFPEGTNVVTMKLASSYISPDQAKKNLELEISDSDTFETIFEKAQTTWDDQLGIIELEGATHDQLVTFYSGMYRLYAYPNLYSENTGTNENPDWKYSSPYGGTLASPKVVSGKLYVNNGFWDTYRTTWAAYALLTPERDTEMLNGLVQHYNDQGWLPRWIAPGGTNSMVGTSSDVIFGDAIMKGIEFDSENALKSALKNGAVVSSNLTLGGRSELESSIFRGYTSTAVGEGFSWAMEGYINDFGISLLASELGHKDEAAYYRNRALNYVNLYNKNVGFFMGKNPDGTFRNNNPSTFNPANWWGDYTETNAWNMAFTVVQDGQGLANLYGGHEGLKAKLDAMFGDDLRNTQSGDIHEMKEAREVKIGQYGHSNQPSHHLPYMYNYAAAPYRTQEIVRDVLARCYVGSDIGQGYIGDEDNGEMSAWYILSSLGFYPVSMGNAEYAIGSPLFKKATIHLENGKDLVINAPENSRENIYVQGVKLNDEDYNKNYFLHSDLAAGGVIDFEMGNKPSTWGSAEDSVPTSLTEGDSPAAPHADIVPAGVATATAAPGNITGPVVYSPNVNNLDRLFDNTSSSSVQLNSDYSVINFATDKPQLVSIYTITSDKADKAPTDVTISGSNNGSNWIELDKRTGLEFEWDKYTRPFVIPEEKQDFYSYYRIQLGNGKGDSQVAEIEFLGTDKTLEFTSGVYDIDTDKKLITDVSADTTVEDFKKNFDVDVVVYKNGVELKQGKVSTDCTVAAVGNEDTKYTVVITGDVNSDGSITVTDIVALRSLIMADSNPTAAQKLAADITAEGEWTVSDIVGLRSLIMGN